MLRSRYEAAPSAERSPRRPVGRRRHVATVAGLAIVLSALVPTGETIADASRSQVDERQRREEIRAERAQAAAQLDALKASDAELESAVATLQANVGAQQARVNDAQREVQAARDEAARLEAELHATEAEVARLEGEARRRAIESYTGFGTSELSAITEGDPTDAERRKALLEAVSGNEADIVDQLGGASARLQEQREQVAAALAEAEARQAEADRRLGELEAARAEQVRLQAALQTRIGEYRAEVDALTAEEATLDRIIAERQAAAEAARRQEAADRLARQQAASRSTTTRAGASSSTTSGAGGSGTSPVPTTDPGPPPPSVGGLSWPCNGTITSGYGQRWGRLHAGVDISAPTGTPIYAAKGGTVIHAGPQGAYGNLVLIDHGGGFVTAYAHQSQIATSVGASVSGGQVIGYVGSTGRSTGPHLHFETRVGGSARDPMGFF